MEDPIIASAAVRRAVGWTARHDDMAALIMKQYSLKLPRDRELIRQLTLVRIQQGMGVRGSSVLYPASWEDDDAQPA